MTPLNNLQETPGNIRADHHCSTRAIFLQGHPLNNLPESLVLARKIQFKNKFKLPTKSSSMLLLVDRSRILVDPDIFPTSSHQQG